MASEVDRTLYDDLSLAMRSGSDLGQARCLRELAWQRLAHGRRAMAVRLMVAAVAAARLAGPLPFADAASDFGELLLQLEHGRAALAVLPDAVEVYRVAGVRRELALALERLARARAALGRPGLAEAGWLAAAAAWHAAGDTRAAGRAQARGAEQALARGDQDAARALLAAALPALEDGRDTLAVWVCGELGALAFAADDLAAAVDLLARAAARDAALGRWEAHARRAHTLGCAQGALGRLPEARAALSSAVAAWRRAAHPEGEALSVATLAELIAGGGAEADAIRLCERAIDLAARCRFAPALGVALAVLQRLPSKAGQSALARARAALVGAGFAGAGMGDSAP